MITGRPTTYQPELLLPYLQPIWKATDYACGRRLVAMLPEWVPAYEQYERVPLETRDRMIAGMRETTLKHVRELAEIAVQETGLGRVEDKIKKNTLCATKTPGTEILRPVSYSGDHGLTVIERAPYGVFGAITPTTNPTETVINNGIGMLSGGNTVVFNTHPSAWRVCAWHVHLLNEAITSAGGPTKVMPRSRARDASLGLSDKKP